MGLMDKAKEPAAPAKKLTAGLLLPLALVVAGCGGTKTKTVTKTVTKTPAACVQALDEADAAFTQMGDAITTVKRAFDAAANGNPAKGTRMLQAVHLPSPDQYKANETSCRAAS